MTSELGVIKRYILNIDGGTIDYTGKDAYTYLDVNFEGGIVLTSSTNRFRITMKQIVIQYGFQQLNQYNSRMEVVFTDSGGNDNPAVVIPVPYGNYNLPNWQTWLKATLQTYLTPQGIIDNPQFFFNWDQNTQLQSYRLTTTGGLAKITIKNTPTWSRLFGAQAQDIVINQVGWVSPVIGNVNIINSLSIGTSVGGNSSPMDSYRMLANGDLAVNSILCTFPIYQNFPGWIIPDCSTIPPVLLGSDRISKLDFFLIPGDRVDDKFYVLDMTLPWRLQLVIEEVVGDYGGYMKSLMAAAILEAEKIKNQVKTSIDQVVRGQNIANRLQDMTKEQRFRLIGSANQLNGFRSIVPDQISNPGVRTRSQTKRSRDDESTEDTIGIEIGAKRYRTYETALGSGASTHQHGQESTNTYTDIVNANSSG